MRKFLTSFLMLTFSVMLMAQGDITGTLIDAENGDPLVYAPVTIKGTNIGVSTDIDGKFEFRNLEAGTYTLVFSYIGYSESTQEVTVASRPVELGVVSLASGALGLEEIKVIASIIDDRQTPVAVSNISSEEIEDKVGNQEFPEILKTTPSVYTTKQGGGFGDARINVRGFDQRNTAVMINGIPVNDMENGWVYWSNWAGLSDATRTMQIQRGLGASKLAINSVGGTINIITKTTDMKAGGIAKLSVGNDGYLKYGLTASTGQLKGDWAITLSGSRTQGDGYVDGTYIDAYNYFGSISKGFGDNHMLSFTAIGAPQRHGQRTSRTDFENYPNNAEYDRRHNPDWGYLNKEVFSLRENFYHKPQFALNHSWDNNGKFFLGTSVYYSVGRGGGTGDRGRIDGKGTWGYRDAEGQIRFDDIKAWNTGTEGIEGFPTQGNLNQPNLGYVAGENTGIIRRASINSHNWMGALSTFKMDFNDNLSFMAGVDLRNYKGLHYRRVDDLLGADYWLESRDVNAQETMVDIDGDGMIGSREEGTLVKKGDKINYDNDGLVDWEGVFTQLEYKADFGLTAFLALSGSNTGYKRVDRFNYTPEEGQASDRFNFLGYTAKGGVNYNFTQNHNTYFNAGYYNRAPGFDALFPNFTNDANEGVLNEKVIGLELGYGISYKNVSVNFNLYNTIWNDKTYFDNFTNINGDRFTANITGLTAVHRGLEVDAMSNPIKGLKLQGMVSIGDWEWKNNVEALIADDDNIVVDTVRVFADGLKVGDAAQFTLSAGATYTLPFGLGFDVDAQYYADLYAQFDPVNRSTAELEGIQPIRIPSYGLLNLGLFYKFKLNGYGAKVRFNMNNVMDKIYISEANDFVSKTMTNTERIQNTNGFYGLGRTWNVGFTFDFWK